jgi:2-polyprenyl-3-methyl-5-hydroxy-6-metoxy-1,4-benzoquinol methylase
MLIVVNDDRTEEWEELARREPYFALLNDDGSLGVAGNTSATEAFFDSGESDIAVLLKAIASVYGRAVSLKSTLDFGCGAGRLTLPLARRASRVVACDIAPAILDYARANAELAGLGNVSFIQSRELVGRTAGEFDFICSLLVFEHIPSTIGYEIIRSLVRLLAPAGVAALHVPLRRPTDTLRRLVRLRSRPEHRTRGIIRPVLLRDPIANRSDYDQRSVLRQIELAGARLVARLPTHHDQRAGGVMIIEKPKAGLHTTS